jgi:hypothetical protein
MRFQGRSASPSSAATARTSGEEDPPVALDRARQALVVGVEAVVRDAGGDVAKADG